MMRPVSGKVAAILFLVLLWGAGSAAQTAGQERPRVTLAVSSGTQGEETGVSLRLDGPEEIPIRRIEAVIRFPVPSLALRRIDSDPVSEEAVRITREPQDAKEGLGTVGLVLEASRAGERLPSGGLAKVIFMIPEDTKPELLRLDLQAKAFTLDQQEVGAIDVYGGWLQVETLGVFVCFFYMH